MGHAHWPLMTPLPLAGGRPLTSDSLLSSVAENYGVANLRPKIDSSTDRTEMPRENCHRNGNTKRIRNHHENSVEADQSRFHLRLDTQAFPLNHLSPSRGRLLLGRDWLAVLSAGQLTRGRPTSPFICYCFLCSS